eukprot:GHRQ01036752.1.p2 GENE.GHRQ01036752.1~~GHRQ01036752.1.p2  ORF type:complete len:101 (+),score=18.12 GHRQ01036752.1:250-552(+)
MCCVKLFATAGSSSMFGEWGFWYIQRMQGAASDFWTAYCCQCVQPSEIYAAFKLVSGSSPTSKFVWKATAFTARAADSSTVMQGQVGDRAPRYAWWPVTS